MEWINFKDKKPTTNQLCIVSTGPDNHAQVLAVRCDAYMTRNFTGRRT